MKQRFAILAAVVLAMGCITPAGAQFPTGTIFEEKPLTVSAVPQYTSVTPGQTFYVAAEVRIKKGWAYYSPNPGKSGDFAPLPAGMAVRAGRADGDATILATEAAPLPQPTEVLWPADAPHEAMIGGTRFVNNAYEGAIAVFASVTLPADTAEGRYLIELSPKGQVCGEDKCIRIDRIRATAEVTVAGSAVANPLWTSALSDNLKLARPAGELSRQGDEPKETGAATTAGLDYGVVGGLALALLAGLILNIMPCVLPVIPLKVLSIVQQAKESRRRFVVLGLAFAGGIVLFFAALAALNVVLKLVLQSAFQWGEHFQYPAFLIGMSMLMVALAMNLFGVFNVLVPRGVAALEAKERREGVASAVGMGLLTGVLSTPCSFAILTSAFTWAQAQSIVLGSTGILMIGVGMALPYAVLTAFPSLVKRLPRPGRWMELFKQSMGFVLLLVAVWLLNPLGEQSYPFWVAAYGVVLAFALWMWGSWVRYDSPIRKKVIVRGVAVLLAAGAGFLMLQKPGELAVKFEPYDQVRIDSALKDGQTVLIDLTADWCLNCKTVEKLVYDDPDVAKALADANVLAIKGDITRSDMPANALRDRLNEAIPVTVIYFPGTKEPVRLRGIFSKAELLDALDKGKK